MLSSWKPRLVLAAAALAVAAAPALADTDTDILTVRVTVQEACTISGTTIDFGTYSAGQQAALDAQGDIRYDGCAVGTLVISLDGGSAANVNGRKMRNGDAELNYQLYRNPGRSQVWGSGDQAVQQVLLEALVPGVISVFGRVAGGQSVPAGTYTDTVNVTMTF